MFSIWASQTLRFLVGRYPETSVPFLRIGPDALQRARRGETRLTYLYREIAFEPAQTAPMEAPEGTVTEESTDEVD
jgi:hypothetical protein